MTVAVVVAVATVAPAVAVLAADRVARLRHWRIGRWSWPLSAGYGGCRRCETSWRYAAPHVTPYRPGKGVMALCERCWRDLATPEARYPFYVDLLADWTKIYERVGGENEIAAIRLASSDVAASVRVGG